MDTNIIGVYRLSIFSLKTKSEKWLINIDEMDNNKMIFLHILKNMFKDTYDSIHQLDILETNPERGSGDGRCISLFYIINMNDYIINNLIHPRCSFIYYLTNMLTKISFSKM